jgi:hypothetical protein
VIGDGSSLIAATRVADGRSVCPTAGVADPRSGTLMLTAQLLETRVNDPKIVCRARARALAPQFFDASADHCKIVCRAGLGHSFPRLF